MILYKSLVCDDERFLNIKCDPAPVKVHFRCYTVGRRLAQYSQFHDVSLIKYCLVIVKVWKILRMCLKQVEIYWYVFLQKLWLYDNTVQHCTYYYQNDDSVERYTEESECFELNFWYQDDDYIYEMKDVSHIKTIIVNYLNCIYFYWEITPIVNDAD